MHLFRLRLCVSVLLLITFALPAQAQYVQIGRRAGSKEAPPKALLIELLTRGNQRAFLRQFRPDLLPEFDNDVQSVMANTVTDWSRYFHFCPVYFFIDTNASLVRNGNFSGILLDSNLQPVAHPAIQNGERNIYIGYYGSPVPQPEQNSRDTTDNSPDSDPNSSDASSLIRERFLVMDADFHMLGPGKPQTNYFRKIRPDYMNRREYRSYWKSISHNAKRWYIDYQPTAYSYDATLRRYFR
ncbi:MAG: hypothetical protein JST06_07770 [Bacteroidetes bacterium]|nr:hypothetical protein [Bacteroidota bacterium]MBS1629140.1 hypothetical protein [Bacteroidota bacterium]